MKRYKYYRLSKLLPLGLLLLLSIHYADAKKIKIDSKTKIIFQKYNSEHFRLRRYLQTADNLTSMLLRSRRNLKLLPRIIVIDKKNIKQDINIVQAGKSINIYINSQLEQWEDNSIVNKQLISTLLFAKCDIKPSDKLLPDWLLTGIYAELKYKTSKKIFSPAAYLPGVMAFARTGQVPDLSTITIHPLKKVDGNAYLLYEEFCRFLLNISEKLCRDDDEIFTEIVVLAATGNYSQREIFDSTIGRVVAKYYRSKKELGASDSKVANQWFKKILLSKAANYFFPLSAKTIDQKFNQLFPIECEIKIVGEKYKAVSITLMQLSKMWSKIKQPFSVKSSLVDQLGKIIDQAPAMLSASLYTIRLQISNIGKANPVTEQQALKSALNNYHQALAQQTAIENYLDDIENGKNNISDYHYRQLEVMKSNQVTPWQAMKIYLDKVEKKYLE